jgi:hypothetical protein
MTVTGPAAEAVGAENVGKLLGGSMQVKSAQPRAAKVDIR